MEKRDLTPEIVDGVAVTFEAASSAGRRLAWLGITETGVLKR